MSICLACRVHPKKLCGIHARTSNLHEPDDSTLLLIDAHDALEDTGKKAVLHRAQVAGRIARFLARQRGLA